MDDLEPYLQAIPAVLTIVLGISILGGIAFACRSIMRVSSVSALQHWAAGNNLTLLYSERRYFLKGPFFFTTSNTQSVYRIGVRDAAGVTWHGWARYGGWFLGPLSGGIEVRWS